MDEPRSLYDAMWDSALKRFQRNDFELDPLIRDPGDSRRGVTLLARFSDKIGSEMEAFVREAAALEPDQHYYNRRDFHLTVLSIITCYAGFSLSRIDRKGHVELIGDCLKDIDGFSIRFCGITASPSCVMIQGFPLDPQLDRLRDRVREAYGSSNLERSIDSRYVIKSAHATVIRFCEPLKDHARFIRYLEKHRSHPFGVLEVDALELVYNDWYQRTENTVSLSRFNLGSGHEDLA